MATRRIDPFGFLNYDCTSLVLSNLTLYDLACAQRVSKDWKALIEDWSCKQGFLQHFPDVPPTENSAAPGQQQGTGSEATKDERDAEVARFKRYMIEGTCDERWAAGHALSVQEYTVHGSVPQAIGDFLVLQTADTILWDQVCRRKQRRGDSSLQPINTNSLRYNTGTATTAMKVRSRMLHAAGLLQFDLQEDLPLNTGRIWEYMAELETGKVLWSKPKPTIAYGGGRNHHWSPVATGWDRIYYYGDNNLDIQAFDLRTGALLYTRQEFVPRKEFFSYSILQCWRLNGREVLVTYVKSNTRNDGGQEECKLCFVDPENGQTIQTIPFVKFRGPLDIKVSHRRNEPAFALLSYNSTGSHPGVVKIQTFDYHRATGMFRQRGIEDIDLFAQGVYYNNEIDCDPFRGIIVAADGPASMRSASHDPDTTGAPIRIYPLRPGQGSTNPSRCKELVVGTDTKESYRITQGRGNIVNSWIWSLRIAGNRLFVGYSFASLNGTGDRIRTDEIAVFDFGTPGSSALGEGKCCLHRASGFGMRFR
ncbi:uncharacterized protein DSM5745_00088 [Aspergillus mulundensis]|uniref:F-box domain-containing protein n=1 Tax=Aspergillus mulundensis TaxID=1810919 RepID=A0A3D8T2H5_9EURO|nr:hypothetical protein DSM5745_00088 [Aspergillus mulundensis]RDW92766.1 hypothetical protein DSM5745_00088 [Aspergillus mulundensis]